MSDAFVLQQTLPTSSRLVFGCMGLGGSWDAQPVTEANVAHAHAAVEAALEIGITLFDHADIYTLGKAESVFGTLLKRQPALRDRILLQSKCGIRFGDELGPKRYDLSYDYLLASVDGILARLGVDYLDTLLLHRPDALMDPAEVAEAWLRLKLSGKVRHLGVSNMHSGQMALLQRELAGDIYRNGVVLTGGGAQLHGLPEYLSQELKVEVTVSPDPVNCVALGTAMSLRLGDKLETGFMDATPRMGRR